MAREPGCPQLPQLPFDIFSSVLHIRLSNMVYRWQPLSINQMFWFKNSNTVEETELDEELQDSYNDSDIGTRVPVDSSGVRPRERVLYTFQTHRGLKSRHIQLIALGGSIGTGLFVGTGTTLSLAGPAPLFMCTSPVSSLIWLKVLTNNVYSLHCHISYRLGCGSKPGRDDNLSSGRRSFSAILCTPLLRTFFGFCSWLELLVFLCYAGSR